LGVLVLQWGGCKKDYVVVSLMEPEENPLYLKKMGLILLSSDETETCARIYTSRHHYIDLKKKNVFASSTKF
jgi:hypothetical protein